MIYVWFLLFPCIFSFDYFRFFQNGLKRDFFVAYDECSTNICVVVLTGGLSSSTYVDEMRLCYKRDP
jgi:hypothetical protein